MVWCSYCAKDQETESDDINGFTCCTGCGRVLDDNVYSSDPTFTKSADGQSQLQGTFIKDRQYSRTESGSQYGYATDSHEKTLEKGRNEIRDIADFLAIGGKEDAVSAAHRLYMLAVERNFTRGRRTNQVAAACLYIICRQDQKPFLLIDFSDCLQTNVYILGAVFLQLCRLLSLEQHPIMQKPVDPSLFIHRFTDRLVGRTAGHGKKFHSIANTALRLVASMKRDWMQTGRRPSGICGAALFISAHIHGFECTKTDVVSVVHICEGTLTKRLIEFEQTESGTLTAEEFDARAKEFELLSQNIEPVKATSADDSKREVLCEHKELGATHFAVGLCKSCYEEFIRVSGGIIGGAHPPAFQASEKKKLEEEQKKLQKLSLISDSDGKLTQNEAAVKEEVLKCGRGRPKGQRKKTDGKKEDIATGGEMRGQLPIESFAFKGKRMWRRGGREGSASEGKETMTVSDQAKNESAPTASCQDQKAPVSGKPGLEAASVCIQESEVTVGLHKAADTCTNSDKLASRQCSGQESVVGCEAHIENDDSQFLFEKASDSGKDEETLSDIDDSEVDGYLHTKEEIRLKTIIWTEMNKDYLEEQQAKEEALAASQAAQAAALAAAGADSVELAAAAAAAVAELRKDRKRKRAEAKNKGPAESADEATRQMFETKKFSSKLNYSALGKLFDVEDATKDMDAKIKHDEKETPNAKIKQVKWADDVVTTDTTRVQESKVPKEQEGEKEGEATDKDDGEEDDYEGDHDDTDNIEDDQLSSYPPPYDDDYDDYDY